MTTTISVLCPSLSPLITQILRIYIDFHTLPLSSALKTAGFAGDAPMPIRHNYMTAGLLKGGGLLGASLKKCHGIENLSKA